jgi:hypothetical protein
MKPPRTALPLPRYVQRKPLKSGVWGHFFTVPTWARKAGCLVASEALGVDYDAAVKRAETVLLPALDSWRSGGATDKGQSAAGAKPNTLDWVFAQYRGDRRFTKLDDKTKRTHELGFRLVGGYTLKDGRRLGQASLSAITTAITDAVYEKLILVAATDADGNPVERERRTTINHAMKSCRRAWNVAARSNPGKVPLTNPFARMGLVDVSKATPTATYPELQAFRAKAAEMGFPSLATAALIGWEFLQREEDIFGALDVAHYRPKERSDAVRVVHEKTHEENWVPLFDDAGAPLYPELMAELDAIRRERIGGLMLRRDWGDRLPWPTDKGDLTLMRHKAKAVIRAAGLRDELSFTSFRHGGFTEAADSDLTDAEIRAGPAQVGEGAATIRQADHETGRGRGEEAPVDANKGRTLVRMSRRLVVRMAFPDLDKPLFLLATPAGLEPATCRLEGGCSIQLSYGAESLLVAGPFM